ncbi:VapC toxin family PIN domain ribonuclease [Hymenobacter amundsenii]|uniref:Ribonuclease VapC n=1 Tax=Hymenobacter amundsenii TaxID=2006685 RepID=A0A246FLD5_9BACT|nr:type II toxin-antitoxin system VapC family toxin [Hymenobacter amundsenii]OWP63530.1 VapC toxin family PIN domain ribonuclease [Hymenobacter amundsenii]
MSPRYLLDTNICIHYLKGEFGIATRVRMIGLENCFLSEITVAELLFGVANSAPAWQTKRQLDVAALRHSFAERVLSISPALETFAEVKTHLRRLGRAVDSFDLLIGSTALVHNLTLVTHNTRHFTDMPNIALQDWVAEQQAADESVNAK